MTFKRSTTTWRCDLCRCDYEVAARPMDKTAVPDGWTTHHVASSDAKRYEIDKAPLIFCSPAHKVSFLEASTKASVLAAAAGEEAMQLAFVAEMTRAKKAARDAISQLGDIVRPVE